MSTLKSSAENLTLNADGSGNDIKFQSNASEVAEITDGGVISSTGGSTHADNVKAKFGTGNDLEIYHNGTHSYISDQGTGDLKIFSSKVEIQSPDAGENIAIFNDDGAVELFYDNAQKLVTSATGVTVTGGVAIGGTAAANILDDYEEGQWTAALTPGSGSITMSAATMSYTKIGRLVYIGGYISLNAISSPAVSLKLTGLPFTVRNNNDAKGSMSFWANGLASNEIIEWVGEFIPNQTYCHFYRGASGVITDDTHGDLDSSVDFRFMFSYITDA